MVSGTYDLSHTKLFGRLLGSSDVGDYDAQIPSSCNYGYLGAEEPEMIIIKTAIIKILKPNFSADLNSELLCKDPTCLNLVRGSQPKDLRMRVVFSHLHRHPGVINTAFLSFLDIAS